MAISVVVAVEPVADELIKRIDKLLCANGGASEGVVDEAWEPEQPEDWTYQDDNNDDEDSDIDPYGSVDSDDDTTEDGEDLS